ncbi:hypothetical protein ACFW1A_01265 [Kitasatospora sp. NPDC058965]|uniref:hypothetical protein n=1 Tax=Kitasatospora sp. NPDC058965 TaxID=3346682 RepID=UPI003676BFCB
MEIDANSPHPSVAGPGSHTAAGPVPSPEPTPTRERLLDLVALLLLIVLATVVFAVAGPTAFAAVNGAGVGLFATWRAARPRR